MTNLLQFQTLEWLQMDNIRLQERIAKKKETKQQQKWTEKEKSVVIVIVCLVFSSQTHKSPNKNDRNKLGMNEN